MVGRRDSDSSPDKEPLIQTKTVEGKVVERCFFGDVADNDREGVNEPGQHQYDAKTFGNQRYASTEDLVLDDETRRIMERMNAHPEADPSSRASDIDCGSCDGFKTSCPMYQPASHLYDPASRKSPGSR